MDCQLSSPLRGKCYFSPLCSSFFLVNKPAYLRPHHDLNLERLLERKPQPGERLAKLVTAFLLRALDDASAHLTFHGTLTAKQVLFDEDFKPKLGGWEERLEDEALTMDENTCPDDLQATMKNPKGDPSSRDAWSVGVLLYRMLTAKMPYSKQNFEELRYLSRALPPIELHDVESSQLA